MKPYKLVLVSIVVIGLLLGGFLTLQTLAQTINLDARITPPFNSLEDPVPEYLTITLSGFPKPLEPADVDLASIWVGAAVQMAEIEDWPKIGKNTLRFKVVGSELYSFVVMPYIWHLAPEPLERVDVDISVTGQFDTGEAFQGTCTLTIQAEKQELDDPPPPP